MTHMIRAALVSLGLLALATSAGAECAWVLWGSPTGQVYEYTEPKPDKTIKDTLVPLANPPLDRPAPWVQHAYPTYAECRRAEQPEPMLVKGQTTAGRRMWIEAKLVCFPDTIDLRGPKGGG